MKKENSRESLDEKFAKLRIKDLNDDAFMVAEHLRQPMVTPRDPGVWTKTDKERRLWRKYRRFPVPTGVSATRSRSFSTPGTLIVYVAGSVYKMANKTTFSHKCTASDVAFVVSKYKTSTSQVLKYQWNGKTYSADSLPLRRA